MWDKFFTLMRQLYFIIVNVSFLFLYFKKNFKIKTAIINIIFIYNSNLINYILFIFKKLFKYSISALSLVESKYFIAL